MSIDLAAAEELFATSTDATVGLEEEFAILDAASLDLVPRFEELRDLAIADDPVLAEAIAGELISSEIEIRSGRGEDVHDALRRQRDARNRLFALAESRGVALGATGTHPWADYREQRNIDTEHYRRVVDGLRYVARRNNTFSLHVHVGTRDVERAVRACDRLRPVLPLLLSISANSPYLDARDSGLHSARSQAFTKSFPRCGIPDAFGSWKAFRDYIEFLIRTDSIQEYTQVWWSIRPHLSFGTVEVRICDAQTTAQEAEALSALIVASVAQALRDIDEGVPFSRSAAPAGRGELLARDPLRAGRDAARSRSRRAVPGGRGDRAAAAVDRPGARRAGDRAELSGAQRRPAPAPRDRRGCQHAGGLRRRGARDQSDLRPGGRDRMSEQQQPEQSQSREPTEEELRAAYEQQLKQIRVEDVLVQTVLSLINLGSLRAGLVPGNESEADPQQLQQAIEAVRALLPQVEPVLGPDARQIRDAISRLQMEYARLAGAGAGGAPSGGEGAEPAPEAAPQGAPPPSNPDDPGPAQSSGRLWVPGR